MKKINFLNLFFIALSFTLLSCGSTENQQGATTTENKSEATIYEVKRDNVLVGKVAIYSDNSIQVECNNRTFVSEMKGDKRKYSVDNEVWYEIKFKDEGFKLRSPDGKLLWKMKIAEDKIKISDNEENTNPYELKLKEDNRCKVVRDEVELGNARWNAETKTMEIESEEGKFTVSSPVFYSAFGVLLADELVLEQQLIIVAELLVR